MPTASVDVAYRPIRVGFLVRRNSMEDVLAAVRFNTWIWGGIRNPILPVDEDSERAAVLINRFRVDVLYAIAWEDEVLKRIVKQHPELRWPRDTVALGLVNPIGRQDELFLADMRMIVSHYWETIFRHGGDSNAALPNWSTNDEHSPLYCAMLGEYGDERPGPRYRRAFEEGLRARDIRIGDDLPVELLERLSPIQATGDQLERHTGWQDEHGVVIGDPRNPEHLANFWNLRSLGLGVAFWPEPDGGSCAAYCIEHLKRVGARPAQDAPEQTVALWRPQGWDGQDVPEGIRAAVEEAGARVVRATVDEDTWRQPTTSPGVWKARSKTVLATVEDDRWGSRRMVLSLPEGPFANSPMDFLHASWIASLSARSEFNYEGHTIRLPSIADLNEWASEALLHILGDVRLSDNEVGFFVDVRAASLDFRLVEEAALVRQMFARAGLEVAVSSAGEATSRIIRQLGDLNACRIFRLPGVRHLLGRSSATYKWEDAERMIIDRNSLSRYRNIGTAGDLLRTMLEKGLLQAGLHVQCPACRTRGRYAPEALAVEIRCTRCGTTFPLAPRLRSSHWEYQGSGFFAHHGEHGAIPVILTLLRLEDPLSAHTAFLVPSHTVAAEGINCESDLLVLRTNWEGEVSAAIGECKGLKDEVTQDDIEKLSAVAEKMRESGVECYLVFSTTRGSFSRSEIALFKRYRDSIQGQWSLDEPFQGWPRPTPILFTEKELRSFEIYDAATRDTVPEKFPQSLRELAKNSAFVYLDDAGAPSASDSDDVGTQDEADERLYI